MTRLTRSQRSLPRPSSAVLRRHFGAQGELCQYKFRSRHSVHSGFTSLILAHELRAALAAVAGGGDGQRASRKQAADGPSWLAFASHVKGSSGEGLFPTPSLPFLFAGEQDVGMQGSADVALSASAAAEKTAAARCRQGHRLRQCGCVHARRGQGNGRPAAVDRI